MKIVKENINDRKNIIYIKNASKTIIKQQNKKSGTGHTKKYVGD